MSEKIAIQEYIKSLGKMEGIVEVMNWNDWIIQVPVGDTLHEIELDVLLAALVEAVRKDREV
jgi:hypothetical protein